MDVIQNALRHAAAGMHVFPVGFKSKIPERGFKWKQRATNIPEEITAMFQPFHNLAVLTGEKSGIFVLDVDASGDKAGFDSLYELENCYSELPGTYQVMTATGGVHYYFKYPEGFGDMRPTAGAIGQYLDIRANDSYVVGVGSRMANGVYKVDCSKPIADAPGWLLALIKDAAKIKKERGEIDESSMIPKGKQHDYLVSVAGGMRRSGANTDEIFTTLWSLNKRKLEEPGPESNIRRIAESMLAYPEEIPQEMTAPFEAREDYDFTSAVKSGLHVMGPYESADYAQAKYKRNVERVIDWQQIHPLLNDDQVLGAVEFEEIFMMIAPSGAGKTDLGLNILLRNKVPSVFLCGDMAAQQITARKVQMVRGTNREETRRIIRGGDFTDAIKAFDHVHMMPGRGTLENIAEVFNRYREQAKIDFKMLMIDYLQLMPEKGSSESERITNLANKLSAFRDAIGCTVVSLIQTRKVEKGQTVEKEDARGSGQIVSAADGIITLQKDEADEGVQNRFTVKVAKTREGQDGQQVSLEKEYPSRILRPYVRQELKAVS